MIVVVALLGLLAGAVTTLAGMGGGLVLTLALAALIDPRSALAIASVALLVGNIHRARLYREHLQWPIALRFVAGGFPGALVGGLLAAGLPDAALHGAMLVLAGLASAKVLLGWRWTAPRGALIPGGAAAGFVTGTSGGGGLIAGPLLLASGLSGRAYVGTGAVGAATIHIARLGGYGAGGLLGRDLLVAGAVCAVAIAAGNLLGDRIRGVLPDGVTPRLEVGAVVGALGLAIAGIA